METGSLVNHLMSGSKGQEPTVGMGVTELMWSDRHAYTIIEVIDSKTLKVQQDTATRTDSNGMSDSQDYRFEPNPQGHTVIITLRKSGRWMRKGEQKGSGWTIGSRSEYHDFSF